jgi:polar amino acid transport system substrate-binding protein
MRAFLLIALTALCHTLMPAAEPVKLVLAMEDQPIFPWNMPDGTGANIELLKLVAADTGVAFTFKTMPWKRCLTSLQANEVDGVVDASFKEERKAMGAFPSKPDGSVDDRRCLHWDDYTLYRPKGAALDFDGKALVGLSGRIATQPGYSIVAKLKEMGIEVEDTAKGDEANLRKVADGKVAGAVLSSGGADRVLQAMPELAAKVERCPKPIQHRALYLMLSHALVKRDPALAERIWSALDAKRKTPEYEAALARLTR